MSEGFDIAKYNDAIREWGRKEKQNLGGHINMLGVRSTGLLLRSLNVKFGQRHGQVNYVGFQIKRYGVFIEKGAGRGYGGRKGSSWQGPRFTTKHTSKGSLGYMGTGARPARPWFNPVMEGAVDRLADIVVEHIADAAIRNIFIK